MNAPKPLPRVSAKHYKPRAAKMLWRLKGSDGQGDEYHGQVLAVPCGTCGGTSAPRPPGSRDSTAKSI